MKAATRLERTYDGALYEVWRGAPARLLPRQGGEKAAYAGDSLVFDRGGALGVIDASGRLRRFGTPTQGQANIPRGTYRDVKVIASGDWTLTIAPR